MARFILFVFVCILPFTGFMQDNTKSRKAAKAEKDAQRTEKINSLLNSKDYIFKATYALPMAGSSIYLSSEYDLRIKADSVFSFLPYFGVAYYADYGGGNGGIEFQEPYTDYTVRASKSKKEIEFKVTTQKDSYRFHLTVSDNGYSSMHVSCNKRQPIQFYGMIEEVKKE